MDSPPMIELVFFEGCPNAIRAREHIQAAIELVGRPGGNTAGWQEWDLLEEATPDFYRRFGSPTVLIGGADVTGPALHGDGMACRADGAPTIETIAAHLR